MKTPKNERGSIELVLVIIGVAVIAVVGWAAYNNYSKKTATTSSPTPVKQISHPGVVISEVFASSLDAKGLPVSPTNTFAATTPKIYTIVKLNNAKATQRVEYTRYLNGKFVDNGSVPLKDGAKYASFDFTLKPGQSHPVGKYVVKTYTNGVFERSATYTVQ